MFDRLIPQLGGLLKTATLNLVDAIFAGDRDEVYALALQVEALAKAIAGITFRRDE
jgi:hypothetical protein